MDGLDRTMADWLGEEPTSRMRQAMETIKLVRCVRNAQPKRVNIVARVMDGNLTIQSRRVVSELAHR
jgi:hypothetical protein